MGEELVIWIEENQAQKNCVDIISVIITQTSLVWGCWYNRGFENLDCYSTENLVIMMATLSSQAATKVVIMTTCVPMMTKLPLWQISKLPVLRQTIHLLPQWSRSVPLSGQPSYKPYISYPSDLDLSHSVVSPHRLVSNISRDQSEGRPCVTWDYCQEQHRQIIL